MNCEGGREVAQNADPARQYLQEQNKAKQKPDLRLICQLRDASLG